MLVVLALAPSNARTKVCKQDANSPLVRAAARPKLAGGLVKCKAADALPSSRLLCTVSQLGVRHGSSP
jgi:hypothetical protein